jgi:integrase
MVGSPRSQSQREWWHKCDTKSQAKALYGRLKSDIREEKYFPEKFASKEDITSRTWIRRCLDGSTNKNKVGEKVYAKRWSLLLGGRLLSDISAEDLRRFQAAMRAKTKLNTKTKQTQRRWRDSTINRFFAYLRRVFTLAIKDNKLSRNPVSGVTFFAESNRTRFLNDEELTRLRNVLSPEAWSWVALAVETGLRQEEQFSLRWDQVDLENAVLTLPLPKGGRTRHVPLSEGAKTILRSFGSFDSSPYVFPSVRDSLKPLSPHSFLRNVYRPALRKAGIQGANWHTLRHTAASRRIMAGVDVVSVKEILGHRDIETTMRYAHLSPAHLKEGVNKGSLGTAVLHTANRDLNWDRESASTAETVQPLDIVVRPEGLEPPTLGSEVRCSIQLSYGRSWPISNTSKKTLSRTGLRHNLYQI